MTMRYLSAVIWPHTKGYSEEVAERDRWGDFPYHPDECHENAESIIRENIGVLHSCAASLLLEKEKDTSVKSLKHFLQQKKKSVLKQKQTNKMHKKILNFE